MIYHYVQLNNLTPADVFHGRKTLTITRSNQEAVKRGKESAF
jgi:hypothetical protein